MNAVEEYEIYKALKINQHVIWKEQLNFTSNIPFIKLYIFKIKISPISSGLGQS